MTFDVPVTVLEMGPGGFSIETADPLAPGEDHEFRFTLADGVSVVLLAKVVHSRPVDRPTSPEKHVAGFEFLDDASPEARAGRVELINRIASVLALERR